MPRDDQSFLSHTEIEAARSILLAIRGKRFSLAAIADGADVSRTDVTNFLSRRGGSDTPFRTTNPNNSFQRRILNYIMLTGSVLEEATIKNEITSVEVLRRKMESSARVPDEDNQFDYLNGIGITTAHRCMEICRELAGQYEVYRLSSDGRVIYKSHMTIEEFDIYDKVPSFTNRISLGIRRRAVRGSIIELEHSFIFSGFTLKSETNDRLAGYYLGSETMVLTKGHTRTGEPMTLMGFYYSSGHEEVYNVGAIRAIRTGKEYNPTELGEIKLPSGTHDQIARSTGAYDLPFKIEDIALIFSDRSIVKNRIFASLSFDMARPRLFPK